MYTISIWKCFCESHDRLENKLVSVKSNTNTKYSRFSIDVQMYTRRHQFYFPIDRYITGGYNDAESRKKMSKERKNLKVVEIVLSARKRKQLDACLSNFLFIRIKWKPLKRWHWTKYTRAAHTLERERERARRPHLLMCIALQNRDGRKWDDESETCCSYSRTNRFGRQ